MPLTFPFFSQLDAMDCGATCLRMISGWYGMRYSGEYLREISYTNREGISLEGMSRAAERIGFKTLAVKIKLDALRTDAPLPCVLHWNQNHFVVLYDIKKSWFLSKGEEMYCIADPAHGKIKLNRSNLQKSWTTDSKEEGIALLLEATPAFYTMQSQFSKESKKGVWSFIYPYFKPYNRYVIQLLIGLLVGTILSFIFPFLTQSIVDIGIRNKNIHFVYLILSANLMLFFSQTIIELIRSRLLLHISARVNISLISDFLIKLMKLPISFFDSKMTGDLIQRIGDHQRIQSFMSGTSLSIIFSVLNLFVFSGILLMYSPMIFAVFLVGSIIYTLWIVIFLKYRRDMDYKRFQQSSLSQSNLIQLIQGMQEIKLQNAEQRNRWQWERIKAQGFKIELQGLNLSNIQSVGSNSINQLKNIFISVLTAKLVIDGQLTLGMMLSVQYIIGQLNAPVAQLLGFVQQLQDATLSLERLNEIHSKPNEEVDSIKKEEFLFNNTFKLAKNQPYRVGETDNISANNLLDIKFENLSFQYSGPDSPEVLKNISFTIPNGKLTAIVGGSGSGKTTLLKLLMKFYEPSKGSIKIGFQDLKNIRGYDWREYFGAVMQDGFIFSDSIARNIAVKDENIDTDKLLQAATIANIKEFIEDLPLNYSTKIGQDGIGISSGQKQRLLIARAIYKEPRLIIFDEATNSLDATNELKIIENMNQYLKNKTAVVVAHRLSTVKDADNIIVLEKGTIVEQGSHSYLTSLKGKYYTLVKNQLELGS